MGVLMITACSVPQNEDHLKEKKSMEREGNEMGSSNNTDANEQEVATVKGMYIGQIDSNSVEIEVDGEPRAFRITDLKKSIETINESDPVKVQYVENEYGQLMVKSIEKIQ